MTDLLVHLRRLSKQLNTHLVQPNRGGCCVIAAAIAEHLEQIVPVRIRVSDDHFDHSYSDDNCNLNDMVNYLGTQASHDMWNDADVSFGHVLVEFDYQGRTYHMDTSGVKLAKKRDPSFGWLMYDGFLPLAAAQTLASDAGNWNKTFNRNQIPVLKKMVMATFKQLTSNPIVV